MNLCTKPIKIWSWEAHNGLTSKETPSILIEGRSSLQCSQEPTAGLYPVPVDCSQRPLRVLKCINRTYDSI